ncbi:MAG: exodeoxyribonuclease III [Treponema sp.]|jgi:exodeoxyribonuclease-3|nr:exodeoxyribonuclease III [Treponema sp.]
MKILSWNVNGIRAVEKKGFLEWLKAESPDMLCIQETKAEPNQLSEGLRNPQGYFSYWTSAKKKGYSGTAIYTKIQPMSVQPLGLAQFDDEGRVTQADYGDFILICAYFPNSQDAAKRLPYKLEFCAAMLEHCKKLVSQGRHIILCGDYNIAHTRIDLARPDSNEHKAGFLPEERAWFDTWLEAGFVDTFRYFYPDKRDCYSWWTYRGGARERNVGWRIDYHCVDKGFLPRVKSAGVKTDVYGSDHCPVEIIAAAQSSQ